MTLGSSLKSIGSFAFKSSALTSVKLPASLVSIGRNAFNDSKKLTAIEFGERVGWYCASEPNAESGRGINADELVSTATACEFLTNEFASYYWIRK